MVMPCDYTIDHQHVGCVWLLIYDLKKDQLWSPCSEDRNLGHSALLLRLLTLPQKQFWLTSGCIVLGVSQVMSDIFSIIYKSKLF